MFPLTDTHGLAPARLEQLFEVVTDGVLALDVQGRLTYVNPSAERLLRHPLRELLGQCLESARPEWGETKLGQACQRALAQGVPTTVEEPLASRGGRLEARLFPSREGLLVLVRDVTPLAQSEEAHRTRDELLATVSHELRTPLTAILGWARILRTSMLPPDKQARALESVEHSARSLARIVDDLMDFSRIAAGRMRLDMQPMELNAEVEAALEAIRPAAAAQDVHLEPLLESGVGPVQGDAPRLRQVAWNLLTHALKFTPEGGRVTVRLGRVDGHVELEVTDPGRGRHGSPGLSLGLGLVQHLVELHGGTVHARSEGEHGGASLTVRLPLAGARTSPGPGQAGPQHLPELSGVRVLVVDDEPDTRELLRVLLEERRAEVALASSAAEAFAALVHAPPDLLVTDIGMPGEDGYALIRQVRSLHPEQGGQVPAAALSAFTRLEDRTRALAAGFQVYLPKPVDPVELVKALAGLVHRCAPR